MVTEEAKKIFKKAKKIKNMDSELYRQDPYGNIMYIHSYGLSSKMGWEIDHIKPIQQGGHDTIVNKQALNTHMNRSKRDSLVKKSRHNNK